MSEIRKVVSEVITQHRDKLPHSADEITKQVDEKLAAIGWRGARQDWDETRNDSSCAPGVSTRICHKVNHGDGTSSETWCDAWHCI
jgi:hypothetical protein